MPTDLAVIVPTRGRPENIRKVISAWDFTNAWDVADLVLAVDKDDPEYDGYLDLAAEYEHPDTRGPLFHIVSFPVWRPMVQKLNETAAELAAEGGYFALGFAGDDHLPQTIGWAKTYLSELRSLVTGMVYGDDGYQGKKLSTEWAVTTDAVVALGGRMIPAPVDHMYCDNAIMEMFEAAGALKHLPQVRIEHMHPIAGKAENDEQYKRVNSSEQFKKDRATYQHWRDREMSADVAVIKALQPNRILATRTVRKDKTRMSRFPFPKSFKQINAVIPDEIAMTLADMAAMVPQDQEIVQLGVYNGRTALITAWGAQQGNGAHVTGIDPWDLDSTSQHEANGRGSERAWARYWVRGLGYSNHINLIRNFSSDAAPVWGGPKIGLLFIGGDDDYAEVYRSVQDWAPHFAPGATIAIDSYLGSGTSMAVNDLVADGTLEPVTVYHDRLAVTRLKQTVGHQDGQAAPEDHVVAVTAHLGLNSITGEGVSPSPYPAVPSQVAVEPTGSSELEPIYVDTLMSTRTVAQPDELIDIEQPTPIEDLNLTQLKTLAKVRGIVLGIRKDKKSEILKALEEGR